MPKLKYMRRLPELGRLHRLRDDTALMFGSDFTNKRDVPEIPEPREVDMYAEQEKDLVDIVLQRLGDRPDQHAVAQRVVGYMMNLSPSPTVPEALVYDYLVESGGTFQYQAHLFGGRSSKGGVVPDFLVNGGGFWSLWNVQGDYWHSPGVNGGRDAALMRRVVGTKILGLNIKFVVELWESDLYDPDKRLLLFELAEVGRGLRG
jgi:hypothetical protein